MRQIGIEPQAGYTVAGGPLLWERSTRAPCESTWLCYMLTDSSDTWKPSERAQCKSHWCSTGTCIMQEARSLALSLSRSLPLCPLLCGKNRSTDLSVQLFFVLLTFTWISPGAAAVGSCLTFLCFCVFVYLRTSLIVACLYACRSTTVHHLTWHFNKSGILVLVVFHFVRVRRSRFVKSVIKPSVSAQSTPHTCVFLSC